MYALVDCNNFYASCEEVFQPKLKLKPLVILSNNDGCVIARSQKAKELGIEMGAPAFQLPFGVQVLSSNFTLYADMSQRVMSVLESFSPDMEIYSIDEAFFILAEESPSTLRELASAMREKVKKWTGIPISIGIAPTKTLAKLANRVAKKSKELSGIAVLEDPHTIRKTLEKTALEEIWGIGKKLAHRLKTKSVYNAAQLIDQEDSRIRKILGVTGYRTVLELRGTPCIELESTEKKQSIVCSRSFPHIVDSLADLEQAVSAFATRAAEKLREQKSRSGFISVFIASSPFQEPYESRSCHIQLPHPSSFTPEIIQFAKQGLSQIYKKQIGYKKAGVLLGDFVDESILQGDLLSADTRTEKKEAAMRALDQINEKYDKPAIRFLAEGIDQTWKSSRSHATPRYTTSWHELLKIT